MRKLLLTLSLLLLACTIYATQSPFASVPAELQRAVKALDTFPKTHSLLVELNKYPPITLKWIPLGKEGQTAIWAGGKREIWLNSEKRWSEGKKITYILMELHNAKTNLELLEIDMLVWNQRIQKHHYVESVEYMEHKNALQTKQLLAEGVLRGFFPHDATYPIHSDFNLHLRLQMSSGHSQYIAKRFDEIMNERTCVNY